MRVNFRGPLGWALAAGLVIAACGGTPTPATSGAPKASTGPRIGSFDRPVVLAFTPSKEAPTIATNGNAIKAALERATGLSWKVTVMTSYAAQVEGMCAGQIDIGFFAPLQMTLLLDRDCGTPVLGALRNETKLDGTKVPLSPTYQSQIIVRADSGITDLNGLKGKKFAFVDTLSASGYVYPTLTIKNKTGQDPKTFFAPNGIIFAGGHPQAALAVYNKQVDGAAVFIDVRNDLLATFPDVKTVLKTIETSLPIPNDGVALAKGFDANLGKTAKQALIDYSKTDDGKKVFFSLYSWDGLQEVDAKFYDSMREAVKLAGVDVAGLAKNTPAPAATPTPAKTP